MSDPPLCEDGAEGGRAESAGGSGSGNDAMFVDVLDNQVCCRYAGEVCRQRYLPITRRTELIEDWFIL